MDKMKLKRNRENEINELLCENKRKKKKESIKN
jgi:hypothetical protein